MARYDNTHIKGGLLIAVKASRHTCLELCTREPLCLSGNLIFHVLFQVRILCRVSLRLQTSEISVRARILCRVPETEVCILTLRLFPNWFYSSEACNVKVTAKSNICHSQGCYLINFSSNGFLKTISYKACSITYKT